MDIEKLKEWQFDIISRWGNTSPLPDVVAIPIIGYEIAIQLTALNETARRIADGLEMANPMMVVDGLHATPNPDSSKENVIVRIVSGEESSI
jgi:hypothetical protein